MKVNLGQEFKTVYGAPMYTDVETKEPYTFKHACIQILIIPEQGLKPEESMRRFVLSTTLATTKDVEYVLKAADAKSLADCAKKHLASTPILYGQFMQMLGELDAE